MSSWRRRRSSGVTASRSASSSRVGRRPCTRGELVARLVDVALPAAQRARRPVLPAQLVEHGAVDARPRELLERRALRRVVAVDRRDQRLEPAGDEVLDLAAGGQLAHLLEDDVLDERGVGHDQPVARLEIGGLLVRAPEGEHVLGRDPLRAQRGGRHGVGVAPGNGAAVDTAGIGPLPEAQHHRFGVTSPRRLKPRPPPPTTRVMDNGPEIAATDTADELVIPGTPADPEPEVPGSGATRSMVDMIASLRSFETGP